MRRTAHLMAMQLESVRVGNLLRSADERAAAAESTGRTLVAMSVAELRDLVEALRCEMAKAHPPSVFYCEEVFATDAGGKG